MIRQCAGKDAAGKQCPDDTGDANKKFCDTHDKAKAQGPKPSPFDVKIVPKAYPESKLNAKGKLEVRLVINITNKGEGASGLKVSVMRNGVDLKVYNPNTDKSTNPIPVTDDWSRTNFLIAFKKEELGDNIELELEAQYPKKVEGKDAIGFGRETLRFTLPTLDKTKVVGGKKKEKCKHCNGTKQCKKEKTGGVVHSCEKCLTADNNDDELATVACSFCS